MDESSGTMREPEVRTALDAGMVLYFWDDKECETVVISKKDKTYLRNGNPVYFQSIFDSFCRDGRFYPLYLDKETGTTFERLVVAEYNGHLEAERKLVKMFGCGSEQAFHTFMCNAIFTEVRRSYNPYLKAYFAEHAGR